MSSNKLRGECEGYGEGLTVAALEVGKDYEVINGAYLVTVTSRSKTHTFFKHAHGEMALPTDLPAALMIFR